MTEQARFGELLDLAHGHLHQAGAVPGRPGSDHDLLDVARSMHTLAGVIGTYLRDAVTGYHAPASKTGKKGVAAPRSAPAGSRWPGACMQARRAAVNAARELEPLAGIGSPVPRGSERGQRIEAAASALAAGRDLLRTHFATRQDGSVEHTSAWAPVITGHVFHRAAATEMAILARHAAALGSSLLTPGYGGPAQPSQPRDALHRACQHLRMLHGSIQVANHGEPLRADDRDLIRAIPVNITPPRRLPDGTEPVTVLCEGVIGAAERLRHSARHSATRTPRSPDLNAESLRHAAAASMVTSHHCAVLLRALAGQPSRRTQVSMDRAADAAELSRSRWLSVARQLDQVTSDMKGYLPADATDARDLALWTGRLAYGDPEWTLASGPHQAARRTQDLAHRPGDVGHVVAAVHHASDALRHLAAAHQQQAWQGARASRFLVATRSLPEDFDVARPYAAATRVRVNLVLSACDRAHQAACKAANRCADAAAAVRAPSQVLSFAAAVSIEPADAAGGKNGHRLSGEAVITERPGFPGSLERSLHDLGVTDAGQLQRAAELDRAGEQLLIDTCLDLQMQASGTSREGAAPAATRYATTDRHHALAAAWHWPQEPSREQPEREP